MKRYLLVVVALLVLASSALAGDPCDRLGDGSKNFVIAPGATLRVQMGGNAACAFIKVDQGVVDWRAFRKHFSAWAGCKPDSTLGDAWARVTEDDPGEWIGVLNGARFFDLRNAAADTAKGRLRWALAQ